QNRLQYARVGGQSARKLARAPVREETRRQMHHVREEIRAQRRYHALGRRRQQVDLNHVERRLHREQQQQANRYLVEKRCVPVLERGVEQHRDDRRKRETCCTRREQTDERDSELADIRLYARKQSRQCGGRYRLTILLRTALRFGGLNRGCSHYLNTCRSTTIATYSSEYMNTNRSVAVESSRPLPQRILMIPYASGAATTSADTR